MKSDLNLMKSGESSINAVKSWPKWVKVVSLVVFFVVIASV